MNIGEEQEVREITPLEEPVPQRQEQEEPMREEPVYVPTRNDRY
jgi:hypothetical protein